MTSDQVVEGAEPHSNRSKFSHGIGRTGDVIAFISKLWLCRGSEEPIDLPPNKSATYSGRKIWKIMKDEVVGNKTNIIRHLVL